MRARARHVQGARTTGQAGVVRWRARQARGALMPARGALMQTAKRRPPRRGVGGARGRERAGPTRSHPEPGRDPAQRRRVLWGRLHGRRGRRGRPPPSDEGGGPEDERRPRAEEQAPTDPSRGGAAAARWAHNPKVGGSNPSPATMQRRRHKAPAFLCFSMQEP